jgi:hypothetical protein
VVSESSRGWKLDKLKQAHKIDVVVALSMACLAAVRGQGEYSYDLWGGAFDWDGGPEDKDAADELYRNELAARIFQLSGGMCWPR